MNRLILTLTLVLLIAAPCWAASKSTTINLSVRIAPVFELAVIGPNDGHIDFGEVNKRSDESMVLQSGDVAISARSNLGRPYQITHSLAKPLATDDGKSFKTEDFTSSGVPITAEPETLFLSDAIGSSKSFNTNYVLTVKPDQPVGDYHSRILYTIVSS